MKKIWIVLIVLLAAGAGAYFYFNRSTSEAQKIPATAAVARGDVENTVLASGILQASSLVSVGAQVSGIVKSVDVSLGQEVKAGDTVVEIDSTNQENAVKSAEASLANIEAQKAAQEVTITKAESSLKRSQDLSSRELVSSADLEAAQATLDSAKAQLKALEAQIEQAQISVDTAKVDLGHTKITAPISGTVVAVLVEGGQTINANSTTPTVIKIANLDTMQIKAEISEADVVKVKPGQSAYFTILGEPDNKIDATLKSIAPAPAEIEDSDTIDSGTAIYYDGMLEVPNPDHTLRIGMTAEVTIVIDQARNVLTVPSSAIQSGPDGQHFVEVWDATAKATKRTPVEVGLDNKVTAQIKSGLEEGQKVVITGTASSSAGSDDSMPRRSPLGF